MDEMENISEENKQPVSGETGEALQMEEQKPEEEKTVYEDPNLGASDTCKAEESAYQPGASQSYQQKDMMDPSPLSLGDSLITILLFTIPCVNFIVALVWAFGGSKNVNRRNLSRAQLIIWAAVTILVIIFYIAFISTVYTAING